MTALAGCVAGLGLPALRVVVIVLWWMMYVRWMQAGELEQQLECTVHRAQLVFCANPWSSKVPGIARQPLGLPYPPSPSSIAALYNQVATVATYQYWSWLLSRHSQKSWLCLMQVVPAAHTAPSQGASWQAALPPEQVQLGP